MDLRHLVKIVVALIIFIIVLIPVTQHAVKDLKEYEEIESNKLLYGYGELSIEDVSQDNDIVLNNSSLLNVITGETKILNLENNQLVFVCLAEWVFGSNRVNTGIYIWVENNEFRFWFNTIMNDTPVTGTCTQVEIKYDLINNQFDNDLQVYVYLNDEPEWDAYMTYWPSTGVIYVDKMTMLVPSFNGTVGNLLEPSDPFESLSIINIDDYSNHSLYEYMGDDFYNVYTKFGEVDTFEIVERDSIEGILIKILPIIVLCCFIVAITYLIGKEFSD